MDLLCCETTSTEKRAYDDKNLQTERVLNNLLKAEEKSAVFTTFPSVQTEVTHHMRKIVAEWMMEVTEEQNCQDEVFLLAANYMDRFLSVCGIRKTQLQLLGTVCMLLASKLRQPSSLACETLVYYTDNSITVDHLRQWELLVLKKLKWDLASVTAQDFLKLILNRLPIESAGISYAMALSHTKILVSLCTRDFAFSRYLPSMIAAASIAAALTGLSWSSKSGYSLQYLLHLLQGITKIDQEYIFECTRRIEDMVKTTTNISHTSNTPNGETENTSACDTRSDECTPPPLPTDKLQEQNTAGTPTDVRDIHF